MKKIIVLSLSLLMLTACANFDIDKPGGSVDIDDNVDIDGIDLNLNQGSQSPSQQAATTVTGDSRIDPTQFEDLVSQYDQARIKTNAGYIQIKFYNEDSPFTVNNFLNLAKLGFFDDIKFHRVIPNFMIQTGDPNSKDNDWSDDGMGGPGYRFKDEFNENKIVKGSLAMANAGPDTNGSQFFIVTAESTSWLDGKHTNFGYVVSGMSVIDAISNVETNPQDHPMVDIIIESIELIKAAPETPQATETEATTEETPVDDIATNETNL